jgi:hypothetical protein
MSWEAFRLTSKSPAELMHVMGPGGVDNLVREMLMACWRSLPEDGRDMAGWRRRVGEVFDRNMKVWSAIKKPTPEAFFANLAPYPSDGHLRQALVLAHMMLPRGKRPIQEVRKFVTDVFERNLEGWERDYATFTKGLAAKKPKAPAKAKQSKSATKPKPRRKQKR